MGRATSPSGRAQSPARSPTRAKSPRRQPPSDDVKLPPNDTGLKMPPPTPIGHRMPADKLAEALPPPKWGQEDPTERKPRFIRLHLRFSQDENLLIVQDPRWGLCAVLTLLGGVVVSGILVTFRYFVWGFLVFFVFLAFAWEMGTSRYVAQTDRLRQQVHLYAVRFGRIVTDESVNFVDVDRWAVSDSSWYRGRQHLVLHRTNYQQIRMSRDRLHKWTGPTVPEAAEALNSLLPPKNSRMRQETVKLEQ